MWTVFTIVAIAIAMGGTNLVVANTEDTCKAKMEVAMRLIEPYSAAAENIVFRDDEEGTYIKIVPKSGFKQKMFEATRIWEDVKESCWGK